jgi:3-deoxy-manno-octulosonate cytidylyltransferase (CMP-KDO synthetase)
MKFLGIIPARYDSTRFPGKPLVDILGKTMIQRVYEQVAGVLDDVYVATDSRRIFEAVKAFGGKVIMTSKKHQSGTDRCYEAFTKVGKRHDVVINIQGDEPFIKPSQIKLIQSCFDDTETQIATLVKAYDSSVGYDVLSPKDTVKVVINKNRQALYFSRSIIPCVINHDFTKWTTVHTYYKHIGLYAYKADVLKEIASLPQSGLEKAESLEQLRWLENGYVIKVGITDEETIGIDTPEDLRKALLNLTNIKLPKKKKTLYLHPNCNLDIAK